MITNLDDDEKIIDMLEKSSPTGVSQIDQRLRNAPWTKRGVTRRRVLILGNLAIIIVVLTLIITPQGNTWAKSLINFFRRSMGEPSSFTASTQAIPPTKTYLPTHIAELVTPPVGDTEGGDFITPTPSTHNEEGAYIYGLSITEAQQLAGYQIRIPGVVLDGYRFDSAIFNTITGEVMQIYKFNPYQAGEDFILSQSPEISQVPVGQTAEVEQIQVGKTLVEYAHGAWSTKQQSSVDTWSSELPSHTFRWEQNGYYFSLTFNLDEIFSPAYLTKADMLAMVEVILGERITLPERLNLNNLANYEDIEKATGFDILSPSVVPEGFIFSHGVYEPENQRVVLLYQPEDGSRVTSGIDMVIFETPILTGTQPDLWKGFPDGAVETVSIGNETGTLVRGAIVNDVYDPNFGLSITWENSGLHIQIRFNAQGYSVQLDPAALLTIARSMR